MRAWVSWDSGSTWTAHDEPMVPQAAVTAPAWWDTAGCRRRVRTTGTRCIRLLAHRGTCLPVPRREYRRG